MATVLGAQWALAICDEAFTNRQCQTRHHDVTRRGTDNEHSMEKNAQPTLTLLAHSDSVAACVGIAWWVGQEQFGRECAGNLWFQMVNSTCKNTMGCTCEKIGTSMIFEIPANISYIMYLSSKGVSKKD